MKKIIIVILVLIIIGLGFYYFILNKNSKTDLPDSNSSLAQTSSGPEVVVGIKNFSFMPNVLAVKAGTKVRWINNDSAPHTVTSDSGKLLDSPTLSPGESFSFTFADIGSVNYHCSIHPAMQGRIAVEQ